MVRPDYLPLLMILVLRLFDLIRRSFCLDSRPEDDPDDPIVAEPAVEAKEDPPNGTS